MNRIWTALAVAVVVFLAATGCNDYGNTFQGNTGAALQFVSPSNVTAGGPDLTITLTGIGFVVQTVVTWNEQTLKTCVITTTAANTCAPANDTGTVVSVTAVVPAALTAKAGTSFVQTINPHSGSGNNGLSNPVPFVVFPPPNPVPKVTSVTPTSAAAGSADLSITIVGTSFLPTSDPSGGSQVRWNTSAQTNLTAGSITSTQITATVPAALLANAGGAIITVYNPPAPPPSGCQVNCTGNGGGGTSNGTTFTINPAGAAAAKVSATSIQEETPAVSTDGRYVAYTAAQNGHSQIFVRDTCLGADSACQPRTVLISSALDGTAANDDSHSPSISSDGRYVAFSSAAPNLVGDSTTGRQVYLRDTCFGADSSCAPSTQLISTDPKGALAGAESILPSISSSGRFVAFLAVSPSQSSSAPTSEKSGSPAANSGFRQVFVRDTCLDAGNCTPSTTRISLQPGDGAGALSSHPGDACGSTAKPAGPAMSGNAGQAALADRNNTATFFTRSVAVDDGVFLALTKGPP